MAGVKQMFPLIICQGFYLASVCQVWRFPPRITALVGSCVEIPCTYNSARISGTSSPVWYIHNYGYSYSDPEILNTRDSSSVIKEYRDRTSLVPGENSCTLRIDPVRGEDSNVYYPGIAEDIYINAYETHRRGAYLTVTDSQRNYYLYVPKILREGEATILRCSAAHTCGSSPPSLQWNKPGQIEKRSAEISDWSGYWNEHSELTYIPSYVDDRTPVQCTATYPNGNKTGRSEMLNIQYAPKNVAVIGMDEVTEGSDVTLQCNSFSKPNVDLYEWYKGKTKLPDRGREITVRNVTWDMEPYSCAAINDVGSGESAPTEIPVQYAPKNLTITITGNDKVIEGSDVRLQCNSFSNPAAYEYEWYKGKTKLPDRGREITVRNMTRDMEPYSCAARNRVGRGESAPTEIPVQYGGSGSRIIILLATIVPIFLLLLALLVYFCWRKRCQNSHETAASPDATYTDLIKSDIGQDYEQLQPGNSAQNTIAGGHVGADHQYENIHK